MRQPRTGLPADGLCHPSTGVRHRTSCPTVARHVRRRSARRMLRHRHAGREPSRGARRSRRGWTPSRTRRSRASDRVPLRGGTRRGGRRRTDAHRHRRADHGARPTTRPGPGPGGAPSRHLPRRSRAETRPREGPRAHHVVRARRHDPATRTSAHRGRRAASRHRDPTRSLRGACRHRPPGQCRHLHRGARHGHHRARPHRNRWHTASWRRHPAHGSCPHPRGGCRSCAVGPGHPSPWARRCSSVLLDRSSTHHGPTVSTTRCTTDGPRRARRRAGHVMVLARVLLARPAQHQRA